MSIIYDRLIEYSNSDAYPFHMPGHKRNMGGDVLSDASRIDITEIDGFDNLHDAQGMILEGQKRAAKLYGADESFFLVNGSTGGILSAIAACVQTGEWIIMARNCHKAVYHAALLGNLKTFYLQPRQKKEFSFCDGFQLQEVKAAVVKFHKMYPDEKIGAVILTSPTYEGILSEIGAIAEYLHENNIPLIVDEAHGAHLGIAENIPQNSCNCGADLVIHSLHKTMPAMTQTALLHVNGDLVDRQRLRRYLSIYQTSSPSYVLMASIDRAVSIMSEKGEDYFKLFLKRKQALLDALAECKKIKVYTGPDADPCKLILSTKESAWNAKILYDRLRVEYHLQMEMASGDYVVAILTVMDTEEGFRRLKEAVLKLDNELQKDEQILNEMNTASESKCGSIHPEIMYHVSEVRYTIAEAFHLPNEEIPYAEAAGRVSADFIYVYPPGIPILAPGEIIIEEQVNLLREVLEQQLDLKGVKNNRIRVVSKSDNR